MTEVNGRIEWLKEDLDSFKAEMNGRFDRLEERIRKLEVMQFRILLTGGGAGIIIGSTVTALINLLVRG